MKNRNNQKLGAITAKTLIVGVDIAKETQWARFVDYRGLELGKTLKERIELVRSGKFDDWDMEDLI